MSRGAQVRNRTMPPGSRGSYPSSCVAQERTGLRAAPPGRGLRKTRRNRVTRNSTILRHQLWRTVTESRRFEERKVYRVERHVCARLPDGRRHSGADVNDSIRAVSRLASRSFSASLTPSPFDSRLVRAVSRPMMMSRCWSSSPPAVCGVSLAQTRVATLKASDEIREAILSPRRRRSPASSRQRSMP